MLRYYTGGPLPLCASASESVKRIGGDLSYDPLSRLDLYEPGTLAVFNPNAGQTSHETAARQAHRSQSVE